MRKLLTLLIIPLLSSIAFSINLEIFNPNNYSLQNYQVKLNISNITKVIGYNFKILYNNNPIPYCFEQSNGECNTSPTDIIWVKVPFIPANQSTFLNVIKTTENNAVNGDQVFDFYDDFNGNNLDSDIMRMVLKLIFKM